MVWTRLRTTSNPTVVLNQFRRNWSESAPGAFNDWLSCRDLCKPGVIMASIEIRKIAPGPRRGLVPYSQNLGWAAFIIKGFVH
jgi:hypothetical protein